MSRPVHSRASQCRIGARSWKKRWQDVDWVQNLKELKILNLNLAFQTGMKATCQGKKTVFLFFFLSQPRGRTWVSGIAGRFFTV